jgi:hypothetical protein|tara:strand:+ start:131 stop:2170 length:2040 start_codon:yes stop_codon:yes gene_type:complete
MAEPRYRYGGDSAIGALLLPERREILQEEQNQFIGYDDRGQAIVQTLPAQYGESEVDFSYSPIVRGAKATGSFLNDIFFGDANEQSEAAGRAVSAVRGVVGGLGDYASSQYEAGMAGGTIYDPETRQITEFDPTAVMVSGAPAGIQAARNTPSNQVIFGTMGSKTANYTPDQRRVMDELERQGMDTENLFLHGTSDDIRQPTSSRTGSRDSGFIGKGFYGATPEGSRISDFYANTAAPRFRNEAGDYSEPNVFPYITKRGNYKQYSLMDKAGMGIVAQRNPEYSQNLTQKNIDEGFIGAEVVDADGSIIERVNYFPDTDTRSALNYDTTDLYSGGGRQGTAIAGGSALRESFRIGDEGFDSRFDSRAKEQQRILDTELTYEGSPIVRPEVSIFDYEGKPFRITMADRTKAGSRITGVEGVDYDLPVELQGGQDFMFANPAGREGQVWAQDRGATSAFLNSFMGLDGKPIADEVLMLPYRMAPSGGDFSTMTGEVMVTHARNAVSKRAKQQADKTIKEFYPTWKGIDNPESIDQIKEMTGDPRKSLLQVMDRDLRNEGGLGIGQARLAVSDRAQYNAPDFNLQNVGIANPYGDSRFEVSGHRTYGQGLAGRPEGILREQDINVFELMPDLVSARGFDSVDSLLRADPATLAKEQYTLRRGTRGGVITEEMLRDIEARRAN